jgi:hypothetical protein
MLARRHILFFVMPALAIALSVISCASYFAPIHCGWRLTQRHWAVAHFYDGRFRLFWVHSNGGPITVAPHRDSPSFRVDTVEPVSELASVGEIGPGAGGVPAWARPMRVGIGNRRSVGAFGGRWSWSPTQPQQAAAPAGITYVRMPTWLPVSVLLLAPLRYVFRGPMLERHRHRRNRCTMCGYSLTGLPEPRCPECGSAIGTELST